MGGAGLLLHSLTFMAALTLGRAITCYSCKSYDSHCAMLPAKGATCNNFYCLKVTFYHYTTGYSYVVRKCSTIGVEDKCTVHDSMGTLTTSCLCNKKLCNGARDSRRTVESAGPLLLALSAALALIR